MAKFTVEHNIDAMIRSMRAQRKKFEGSSHEAMMRVGLLIQTQAKINVRNHKMIYKGDLLNSIKFRIDKKGGNDVLTVGAFGVSYASINEFGSNNITDRVRRAMFRQLRKDGRLGLPGKGVMEGNNFEARPYLQPAFDMHKGKMLAMLRDIARET